MTPSIEDAIAEARRCVEAGDVPGAFAAIDRGLAIETDHPELIFLMGQALRGFGRPAEAAIAFEACAEAHGRSFVTPVRPGITGAAARVALAALRWVAGDREAARQALAQAGACEGLSTEESRAVRDASALFAALEGAEAVPVPLIAPQAEKRDLDSILEATAGASDNPLVMLVRATLLMRTGRPVDAIDGYLQALSYDGADFDAFGGLAAALAACGQPELASRVDAYARAIAGRLATTYTPAPRDGAPVRALDPALVARLEAFLSLGHPKISACMIVKNEEECLAVSIASLAPWVDELFVIDTGSTDRTVAIARAAGATVGFYAWNDDFGAARNASIAEAQHEWILIHDADEILEVQDPIAWKRALYQRGVGGWKIEVVSPNSQGSTSSHLGLHLFRRDPRIRFHYTLHETVARSLDALGMPIKTLDAAVLRHSGYLDDAMAKHAKTERNLLAALRGLEQEPSSVRAHCSVIGAAYIAGRYALVEETFLRMAALEQQGGVDSRTVGVLGLYCATLIELDRRTEAQALLDAEILKLTDQLGLFSQRARIRREAGEGAAAEIDQVLEWLYAQANAARLGRISEASEALRAFSRS